MNNAKEIQIKIEGDDCIISIPKAKKENSPKILSQFSSILDNQLKNTVDFNLSVSNNSDDFINNLKNLNLKKTIPLPMNSNDTLSNSNNNFEITNKSIFDELIEDEDINTQIFSKEKNQKNIKKNSSGSVTKKLNFEHCEKNKLPDCAINANIESKKGSKKKISKSERIKECAINNNNKNEKNISIKQKKSNQEINSKHSSKSMKFLIQEYEKYTNKGIILKNKNTLNINHHSKNKINCNSKGNKIKNNSKEKNKLSRSKSKPEIAIRKNNIDNTNSNRKLNKNSKMKNKSKIIQDKKEKIRKHFDKLLETNSIFKSSYTNYKPNEDFSINNKINKNNSKNTNKRKSTKSNSMNKNANLRYLNENNSNSRYHSSNNSYISSTSTNTGNTCNNTKSLNINNNKKCNYIRKKINQKLFSNMPSSNNKDNCKTNNNINKNIFNLHINKSTQFKQYTHLKSQTLKNYNNIQDANSITPVIFSSNCNFSTVNSPTINRESFLQQNNYSKNILDKNFTQNNFSKGKYTNYKNYNCYNKKKYSMKKHNTENLKNILETNTKNLRKILADARINIIFNNYNDNSQHFYDNHNIDNKISNFNNDSFNYNKNENNMIGYEEFKREIMNNYHFK